MTIVIPYGYIAGVSNPDTQYDRPMNAGEEAIAYTYANGWAGKVFEMSHGKCHIQNDIVEFPGSWQWLGSSGGQSLVSYPAARAGLKTIGYRADQYDSLLAIGLKVHIGDGGTAAGLTTGNAFLGAGVANAFITNGQVLPDVNSGPSTTLLRPAHEFSHNFERFFIDIGGFTMQDPDASQVPTNFTHADGTPFDVNYLLNGNYDPVNGNFNANGIHISMQFYEALLTDDLRRVSTGAQDGISDTMWSFGTPRTIFPR